jgi:para-aminobenzoate synthetase component 1
MHLERPRELTPAGSPGALPRRPDDATCSPIVEELDRSLDPFDVCRRLAHLPHLLFLDSADAGPRFGRYSFVTADAFEWYTARRTASGDPIRALAARLTQLPAVAAVAGLPPFQGGAAGLFGYDLCHHIERTPRPRFDEFGTPDLAVGIYDWVAAFDHVSGDAWLISTGLPEIDLSRRRRRAARRLAFVRSALRSPRRTAWPTGPPIEPAVRFGLPQLPGLESNFDRPGYLAAARRAIDYVHAGDCFQVNLSQRLLHPATEPPLEVYGRLRRRNPAPFAAYFDLGEFIIASASPERFLRVQNGAVETRPIKGTRPRGATPEEDLRRARELLASAKDRAENVMIIDLLRNDLGRVCAYGSVQVAAVCALESYRSVHHLVSEVRGTLRPELGALDLLRASFPGGSVTGAPKVRALEIIAELEPTARGPYCGAIGYIGFDGSMDTNILIRTFTIGGGWLQFPVGGGIVADSTPEEEYAETLDKAEGLLRALR